MLNIPSLPNRAPARWSQSAPHPKDHIQKQQRQQQPQGLQEPESDARDNPQKLKEGEQDIGNPPQQQQQQQQQQQSARPFLDQWFERYEGRMESENAQRALQESRFPSSPDDEEDTSMPTAAAATTSPTKPRRLYSPPDKRQRRHDGLKPTQLFLDDDDSPSLPPRLPSPLLVSEELDDDDDDVSVAGDEDPYALLKATYKDLARVMARFEPILFPQVHGLIMTLANLSQQQQQQQQQQMATFECPTCHVRLKTREILRVHMQRHTEKPRLSCDQCNETFKSTRTLKKHKKNVHHVNL